MIDRTSNSSTNHVISWLLAGDPAIRWQVLSELVGSAESAVERERRKVAREGWGARLLARQDPQGSWGSRRAQKAGSVSPDSGLYTPKWISTTYTLLLLRDFGLPATNRQARRACELLLDRGMRRDGGVNYDRGSRSETCITGMVLSILCHFEVDDDRLDTIADHLLDQQMQDGGWNCQRPYGATHASVHTTMSVLEALRLYERHRRRKVSAMRTAQSRAREFLLVHRLFRSDRTGKIIKPILLRFSFPPRWHYDILRALDYFQAVGAPRDERLAEAMDIVRRRQGADGRWPLQNNYPGKTFFELERIGAPSRWNTLRALRVLKWWDAALV
jgi:hypothetical protein